jgi:predicted acetyltransferase
MPAENLRLRPYRLDDEVIALRAHENMKADNFHFLLGWSGESTWPQFLRQQSDYRRGLNLSVGLVPATQLCADVEGDIVGRVSIRFRLNRELNLTGGHIGYGVLPEYRQRGYATKILHDALIIARAEGLERVLLTCNDDNVASVRVIENCGGVLENVVQIEGSDTLVRRYWIA